MKYSRWQAARQVIKFVLPYRLIVVISLLALLVTSSITLSIGQGVRLLIDQGIATASEQLLRQYVFLFWGLVLALGVGTFARFYAITWLGERVIADIRMRVFNHLIYLHPGFFEQNRALEIQTRVTTDTTLLQTVVGSSFSIALRNLIMLIGGIIWLFITNAKLTIIVAVAVPLVIAPIIIVGRRVRRLSKTTQDKVADVGAYVGEVLGNIKTVQAYNHQILDQQRFQRFADSAFNMAMKRNLQRGLLLFVVILLVLGAVGIMLWVGGLDVIEGKISGGELAAFVFYSVIVGSAVMSISEVIGELQLAAGAAQRIVELLASESAVKEPKVALLPNGKVRGELVIHELTYAYDSRPEVPAIENLNLQIEAGETLALVGPSGAGKSTLFDLLLRFFDSNRGTIYLDGIDTKSIGLARLRSCFALVSQNPALFFGSIADNIRYAKPNASEDEIVAVAKAAHAHDFISQLPQGYDTALGDGGVGLSGGQKQRIAIARAILADAPILLLDEATSALDAESEYWVQQALDQLMEGRTSIVIAHRLATVKSADRIAVLNHGRLDSLGTHQQLIQVSPLYERLAALQFKQPDQPE